MEVSDPSQPSEETPLVGDAESPASTATGTSVGATSVREAEAAAPWPATLERGLSLLATPQIGDAQFADAVTKSPRFGYYNAAAGAGGLRQRKVCRPSICCATMLSCLLVLENSDAVFWLPKLICATNLIKSISLSRFTGRILHSRCGATGLSSFVVAW